MYKTTTISGLLPFSRLRYYKDKLVSIHNDLVTFKSLSAPVDHTRPSSISGLTDLFKGRQQRGV